MLTLDHTNTILYSVLMVNIKAIEAIYHWRRWRNPPASHRAYRGEVVHVARLLKYSYTETAGPEVHVAKKWDKELELTSLRLRRPS
jgi:hypothetical protein